MVRITPGNGAGQADPSAGITVTAAGGRLTHVTVRTCGDPVAGGLNRGGTVCHSQWAQAYTVTATASGPAAPSPPPARSAR